MGNLFTRFQALVGTLTTERRVLMLGLDNAGKTTVLYKLSMGDMINHNTLPTVGFNVENVRYKNLDMNIWDVGGQTRIRPLWRHYYVNTDGLIFVVDASDRARVEEAGEELHGILSDPAMQHVKVLIMANKMDVPCALKPVELAKQLGMDQERWRKWHIQPTVATRGEGLYEGIDWLFEAMKA